MARPAYHRLDAAVGADAANHLADVLFRMRIRGSRLVRQRFLVIVAVFGVGLNVIALSGGPRALGARSSPRFIVFAHAATDQWQIHDLGTLGGPSSLAVAANEAGQVVGQADTPRRGSYGSYLHHAFLWQDGRMVDLGTLGGPESEAVAINESGQVIGASDIRGTAKGGEPRQHAFLWQDGRMVDLGTLGGPESSAAAINAAGQVVGQADTPRKASDGFYVHHAFLWQNGRMVDLGTLGGPESEATAISNRGTIVGRSDNKSNSWRGSAFKWQRGTMVNLRYPGPPLLTPGGRIARAFGKLSPPGTGYRGGTALALNEEGNTAGYCARSIAGDSPAQPCAWLHGKPVALRLLQHGVRGRALALNNKDQIVGRTGIGPPAGKDHACLWHEGRLLDLGGLQANDWSVAVDITDGSLIVGYSQRTRATAPHAVIWTPSDPS